MSSPRIHHGQCLCGAVQLDCPLTITQVSACHCRTCRRWGGGPLLAVECALPPTIRGSEALGIHRSSSWAERGFCTRCGTHLFYRLTARPHYAIPVGLLDTSSDWILDDEIFIEEKPAWYCFAHSLRQRTGAEALADQD